MNKRLSLTTLTHNLLEKELTEGDCVIDATVGNGHDTLFLAKQVGRQGCIFGFDVQQQAISTTQLQLKQNQFKNFCLFHASHSEMDIYIPKQQHGKIKLIMFNLGYLPGSDKTIITQANTTLIALKKSIVLLAPNGVLTIMAYPGHSGGEEETKQVKLWSEQLDPLSHTFEIIKSSEKITAPRLFIIKKKT
jgi:predicted methyltransferase